MKIYLRKILSHDVTHEVSITQEIVENFFENNQKFTMQLKNNILKGTVTINSATDARFGGKFKELLRTLGGAEINDIVMIIKQNRNNYILDLIKINDERYNHFNELYLENNENRHIIFEMPNELDISAEIGEDEKRENSIENIELKSCLEIERQPRTNRTFPLNFIVYGAPGTGKTYSMVEYALSIIDNKTIEDFKKENIDRNANIARYKDLVKDGQIVFTTFHQNYGYEEFIQGLRLDNNSTTMSFKIVDGIFKTIADRALNDLDDKNYVIIIDEINRANISKVFGELITLIEEDKRWGELNEMSATLQSGDVFAVPNNLYIVGTMNSADKSISLIDVALRRRFEFIEQRPDSSFIKDEKLKEIYNCFNNKLLEELDSTDLLIGYSYFMNKTEDDLCNILNNSIIPLLYEYFYDNRKKVEAVLNHVIVETKVKIEIIDEKFGRLRVSRGE